MASRLFIVLFMVLALAACKHTPARGPDRNFHLEHGAGAYDHGEGTRSYVPHHHHWRYQ